MQFDPSLSNAELLARARVLASCERGATADVIEHLMEIDRRKLYLGQACSSLSAYCRERLDYSEDEAGKRVRVARLARDVPEVLDELRSGRIHLTGLFLLAPHVTRENAERLIGEACGKSRREIERLIAAHFPRPDVEESVTPTTTSVAAKGADRLKPLSASTVLVQFTASAELYGKIERARELLSHSIPGGELAAVLERAVDELIRLEEKRRLGAGAPRRRRPLKEGSRHVPVEVARAVWQRDGAQCSFTDSQGRRCSERRFITMEHKLPFARGGAPTLENLCLLCSPHNSYTAELAFGANHVERKRKESRQRRARGGKRAAGANATRRTNQTPAANPTRRADQTPATNPTPAANPTRRADQTPAANPTRRADQTPAANPTRRTDPTPAANGTRRADQTPGVMPMPRLNPTLGVTSMPSLEQVAVDTQADHRMRVLSALCGMGFGRREAMRALEQLGYDGERDSATLLRHALARLVPNTTAARHG